MFDLNKVYIFRLGIPIGYTEDILSAIKICNKFDNVTWDFDIIDRSIFFIESLPRLNSSKY